MASEQTIQPRFLLFPFYFSQWQHWPALFQRGAQCVSIPSPLCITNSGSMKNQAQRDLFPGALEMMILQVLKRQSLHGYALAQHIKNVSDDLLQVEEGSLYPALQRMLKGGLVEASWGMSSTNRRVRIYKITNAGAKHLKLEISSFERMFEGIRRVLSPA
jgi:PadR family transcriptional regulator PadR